MAEESLYELLTPYLVNADPAPSSRDPQTISYLSRLGTLSYTELTSTEPASLLQSAQSRLRTLQALSKRSHKSVTTSSAHLAHLSSLLPAFTAQTQSVCNELPELENAAALFAQKYDRSTENAVLDRRKRATLLSRNIDRVMDVLDLPSLLSSTVSAAQASNTGTSTAVGTIASYASALDIHAHIRRLSALYPQSDLIGNIAAQSDAEMQSLATILITSLQSPSLKLAAAMRTIGLLRRVAPELADNDFYGSKWGTLPAKSFSLPPSAIGNDGPLAALFLVCRLRTLYQMLEALDPLRELAAQETLQRQRQSAASISKPQASSATVMGSQSERYLRRYIEIFREQSFSILSMYKSIFCSNLPEAEHSGCGYSAKNPLDEPLLPSPSPIASFSLHLVGMLESTLREYMPNMSDKSAIESLLTQVLYCAGSLGRLGVDFGMTVALLEEDLNGTEQAEGGEAEWVQVMKKHRIQASRLEILARGVGVQRKTSADTQPFPTTSP